MSEKYVCSPGGLLWPKSLITEVPQGFNFHELPDHLTHIMVRQSDGKEYKLRTPTKEAREWQAEINEDKKRARAKGRSDFAPVPALGTWQAFAGTDTTRYVTQFNASWTCPVGPNVSHSHGQTLFYWNGLSPTFGGSPFLQCSVQWGPSSAGTPSLAWGVACWKVVGQLVAGVSTLADVASGAGLVGSIARNSSTAFDLAMVVNGSVATSLNLTGLDGNAFFHCDMALENLNMTDCGDNVVNAVDISNQFIADSLGYAVTSWSTYAPSGGCAYSATNHSLGNPGGFVRLQA